MTGREADFYVYTPPGYDPTASTRYPVLYLLHGFSDDSSAWTAVGFANVILDNLVARRSAPPMLVVMPSGYGALEILTVTTRDDQVRLRNVDRFKDMLLNEVMPHVDRSYRVSASRGDRAIAGLSMGGFESLFVGLNHLDRFAWVGAFSSGTMEGFEQRFPALTAATARDLRLLWIACGTADPLFEVNRRLRAWLTDRQVPHTDVDMPGGGHTWMVWRRNLAAFAPMLFRPKT